MALEYADLLDASTIRIPSLLAALEQVPPCFLVRKALSLLPLPVH